MKTSLYNNDGSLHPEAQFLMSFESSNMSTTEWKKMITAFKDKLSSEDLKEFERLKRYVRNVKWRAENPEKVRAHSAKRKAKNPEKVKAQNARWRAENPDYQANWRAKNPEKEKARSARWRVKNPDHQADWIAKNPEKVKAQNARWRAENPEKLKENDAMWRAKNPEKLKEQRNRPENKLRSAVNTAFKRIRQNKPTDTLKLLGCTWEEAKAHFERLFQEGMTWENHGTGEGKWHIDHIRPVASFKGASEEELKQMNHISNLQPLWSADNLSKSDKWDGELNSKRLYSEV